MIIKEWIKQGIYRLMGDSRRDIIRDVTAELRKEQEQLMTAISCYKEYVSQVEKKVLQELESLAGRQEFIREEYARMEQQLHTHIDLSARDVQIVLSMLEIQGNPLHQEHPYKICTDFPVARKSPDHLHPWGTKNDNTRAPFLSENVKRFFQISGSSALQTSAVQEEELCWMRF